MTEYEGTNLIEVRMPIDIDALQDYLVHNTEGGAQRFGGGRLELKQFNNGASNPTYYIQTGGGERWVIRKKPPPPRLPGAHQVDREFRVQKALAGTDVPVPEMLTLCMDESVIGQEFYVMKFVPGRILLDDRLPKFNEEERKALYTDMNRVLAALHNKDYRQIGLEGYGKVGNYAERQVKTWSRNYIAQDETVAKAAPGDGYTWDPKRMEMLRSYLETNQADFPDKGEVAHGTSGSGTSSSTRPSRRSWPSSTGSSPRSGPRSPTWPTSPPPGAASAPSTRRTAPCRPGSRRRTISCSSTRRTAAGRGWTPTSGATSGR